MLLGVASPAMAFSPSPREDWNSYVIVDGSVPYYVSSYSHSYFCYASSSLDSSNFYFDFSDEGDLNSIYVARPSVPSVNYSLYLYVLGSDGNYSWIQVSTVTARSNSSDSFILLNASENLHTLLFNSIVSSSHPVYLYGSDEVFFPAPPDPMVTLAEQMMEKTPEALDLDGKMKILVPFGISCLALLISLPLLLKVLRRFLG